jgi:hypothetical protein
MASLAVSWSTLLGEEEAPLNAPQSQKQRWVDYPHISLSDGRSVVRWAGYGQMASLAVILEQVAGQRGRAPLRITITEAMID